MKKIKKWLIDDWWLKILSLFIAFILWFVVVQVENPTATVSFSNVQVNLINSEIFDEKDKVYEILDGTDKVRVTVTAPQSVTESLTAGDIVAEADVSDMNADNTIAITVRVATDVSVDSIVSNKQFVKLSLDDKAQKFIKLNVTATGNVAEGYVLGDITLDQNMINISGPKTQISQVASAGVTIDVSNATSTISTNLDIELYDSEGNVLNLSNVTKQTDLVHVTADVLTSKTVSVYANKSGSAADGYLYNGDITISPSTIVIAGTKENITGLSRITITDPVDISGATSDVTETFDISGYLPEGIRMADENSDTIISVTVGIEEASSKTYYVPLQNVTITDIPDEVNMYVSSYSKFLQVTLTGLETELEAVDAESLMATINASDYFALNDITEYDTNLYYMPVKLQLSGSLALAQEVTVPVIVNVKEKEVDE